MGESRTSPPSPTVIAASVKVERRFTDGGKLMVGRGSGTIVAVDRGSALILTNRHVLPSDPEVRTETTRMHIYPEPAEYQGPGTARPGILVTFPSGRQYAAQWLCHDDVADLAACVIVADASMPAPIPLADTVPAPGSPVWHVGYPGGKGPPPRPNSGSVIGFDGSRSGYDPIWKLNLWCQGGDSGSGIFRPSDGALVGVLWGGDAPHGSNRTYCVALPNVKRFVSRCLDRLKGRTPGTAPPGGGPAPDPGSIMPPPSDTANVAMAKANAAHDKLDQLARDFAAAKGSILGNSGRLDTHEGLLAKARQDLDTARAVSTDHGGRLAGAETVLGKLTDGLGKAHQVGDLLSGKLGDVVSKVGAIHEKLAPLESAVATKLPAVEATLGTVASAFPWLAFGAASGGAVPVLALVGWGVSALIRRRSGTAGNVTSIPAAPAAPSMDLGSLLANLKTVAQGQPMQAPAPQQPAPISQGIPAPLPQPWQESKVVEVERPNGQLGALLQAMDALSTVPGMLDPITKLRTMAKQIHSGTPPQNQ